MAWEDWEGHDVVDQGGAKIGTIADIYYDDDTNAPEWARVRTGLFGMRETFIPLRTAQAGDNEVRVPYEKAFVKDAPNVDAEGELSKDDESRLADFYGFAYSDAHSRSGLPEGRVGNGTTDTGRSARQPATSGDNAMTRSEEEMEVNKARRPSELVRLKKHVVTEQQQVTVPVQHEELRVEREPITDANRDAALAGQDLRENEHELTLNEEVVNVDKKVVPKERVRLEKDVRTTEQQVTGEVRKEEIDIDRDRR